MHATTSPPPYPIFIPSKGRASSSNCTWHQLRENDLEHTIVVEPQEFKRYTRVLRGEAYGQKSAQVRLCSSVTKIVALPRNEKGIRYARNYILNYLAPREGWFWIIDDDIRGFFAIQRETLKVVPIDARTALSLILPRDVLQLQPGTCLIGLEYHQFMTRLNFERLLPYIVDSYVNICVCMNQALFPKDPHGKNLLYRFPVREDYDLCMQIIAQGGHTLRYRCVAFQAPGMGTRPGGMTDFYCSKQKLIRSCNQVMEKLWSVQICRERNKGTGLTRRYDLSIRWSALRRASLVAQRRGTSLMSQQKQTSHVIHKFVFSPKKITKIHHSSQTLSPREIKSAVPNESKNEKGTPLNTPKTKLEPKKNRSLPGWKGWVMKEWKNPDLSLQGYRPVSSLTLGQVVYLMHQEAGIIKAIVVDIFRRKTQPDDLSKIQCNESNSAPLHKPVIFSSKRDVVVLPDTKLSLAETTLYVYSAQLYTQEK